jgi:hypothetical protein
VGVALVSPVPAPSRPPALPAAHAPVPFVNADINCIVLTLVLSFATPTAIAIFAHDPGVETVIGMTVNPFAKLDLQEAIDLEWTLKDIKANAGCCVRSIRRTWKN